MVEGVTGIILAGGESRRMAPPAAASAEGGSAQSAGPFRPATGGGVGRNKAFLPWGGSTLLEHVIDTLRPITDELIVAVNDLRPFRHLEGVHVVADLLPGAHALGGLYSGLKAAAHPRAFVCGCDAPFLNPALVRFLIDQADGVDLVIPRTAEGLQPLHAVYGRSALPVIEAQLSRRQWDLGALASRVRAKIVEADVMKRFDPQGLSLFNLNTPEDYVQARELHTTLTDVIDAGMEPGTLRRIIR